MLNPSIGEQSSTDCKDDPLSAKRWIHSSLQGTLARPAGERTAKAIHLHGHSDQLTLNLAHLLEPARE